MKRHLNTLFVTTDDSYLSREGESIVVKRQGKKVLQVPALTLDGLVCIGRSYVSTPLLRLCGDNGLTVSLFSSSGRIIGRFEGPATGNVLLRRDQHRLLLEPTRPAHHRRTLRFWQGSQQPNGHPPGRPRPRRPSATTRRSRRRAGARPSEGGACKGLGRTPRDGGGGRARLLPGIRQSHHAGRPGFRVPRPITASPAEPDQRPALVCIWDSASRHPFGLRGRGA